MGGMFIRRRTELPAAPRVARVGGGPGPDLAGAAAAGGRVGGGRPSGLGSALRNLGATMEAMRIRKEDEEVEDAVREFRLFNSDLQYGSGDPSGQGRALTDEARAAAGDLYGESPDGGGPRGQPGLRYRSGAAAEGATNFWHNAMVKRAEELTGKFNNRQKRLFMAASSGWMQGQYERMAGWEFGESVKAAREKRDADFEAESETAARALGVDAAEFQKGMDEAAREAAEYAAPPAGASAVDALRVLAEGEGDAEKGELNIGENPMVFLRDKDGLVTGYATTESAVVKDGDAYRVLPTVWDGAVHDPGEALARYRETEKGWGLYATREAAEKKAELVHQAEAEFHFQEWNEWLSSHRDELAPELMAAAERGAAPRENAMAAAVEDCYGRIADGGAQAVRDWTAYSVNRCAVPEGRALDGAAKVWRAYSLRALAAVAQGCPEMAAQVLEKARKEAAKGEGLYDGLGLTASDEEAADAIIRKAAKEMKARRAAEEEAAAKALAASAYRDMDAVVYGVAGAKSLDDVQAVVESAGGTDGILKKCQESGLPPSAALGVLDKIDSARRRIQAPLDIMGKETVAVEEERRKGLNDAMAKLTDQVNAEYKKSGATLDGLQVALVQAFEEGSGVPKEEQREMLIRFGGSVRAAVNNRMISAEDYLKYNKFIDKAGDAEMPRAITAVNNVFGIPPGVVPDAKWFDKNNVIVPVPAGTRKKGKKEAFAGEGETVKVSGSDLAQVYAFTVDQLKGKHGGVDPRTAALEAAKTAVAMLYRDEKFPAIMKATALAADAAMRAAQARQKAAEGEAAKEWRANAQGVKTMEQTIDRLSVQLDEAHSPMFPAIGGNLPASSAPILPFRRTFTKSGFFDKDGKKLKKFQTGYVGRERSQAAAVRVRVGPNEYWAVVPTVAEDAEGKPVRLSPAQALERWKRTHRQWAVVGTKEEAARVVEEVDDAVWRTQEDAWENFKQEHWWEMDEKEIRNNRSEQDKHRAWERRMEDKNGGR